MPDPLAPRPCQDCGKEIPLKVLDAIEFLYQGGRINGDTLAGAIEENLKRKPGFDRSLQADGLRPTTDADQVEFALNFLFSVENEHLAAAVRHCGDLGERGGSECERIDYAKWCHQRGPGKNSPEMAAWADSWCRLEAGHTEPHSFESAPAEAAP